MRIWRLMISRHQTVYKWYSYLNKPPFVVTQESTLLPYNATKRERPFRLVDQTKITKLLRLMKLLTGNVSRTIDQLAR